MLKATKLSTFFVNKQQMQKFHQEIQPIGYNAQLPYQAPQHYQDDASSSSSIDARLDGNIDQRGEPQGECFCSNPNYVRNLQKKVMKRELECSFCLGMFVKPVTLGCGHTFCKFCALNYFMKNQLACGICRSEEIFEHPFDMKINVVLDSMSR